MTFKGLVVLVVTVGYVLLALFSLWKWNDATSGTLILGFAFFARDIVGDFIDRNRNGHGGANG